MYYDYYEEVKNDVLDYIENNIDLDEFENREDLYEHLYDELFVEDSVTGNGSGSYTMSNLYNRHRFEDVSDIYKAIDRLSDVLTLINGVSSELRVAIDRWYDGYYFSRVLSQLCDINNSLYNMLDVANAQRDRTNYIHKKEK